MILKDVFRQTQQTTITYVNLFFTGYFSAAEVIFVRPFSILAIL